MKSKRPRVTTTTTREAKIERPTARMFAETEGAHIGLIARGMDVWVNVAVTSLFVVVKEATATEFKRVTEVCYVGHVNGTLAALKWEGKNFEIKAR